MQKMEESRMMVNIPVLMTSQKRTSTIITENIKGQSIRGKGKINLVFKNKKF